MRRIFLLVLAVMAASCSSGTKHNLAPFEIQLLQTREFSATKKIVYASVISVFQDMGYFVESGDFETGLVIAQSPTKNTTGIGSILLGVASRENTRATAFVESFAEGQVRVRLSFAITSVRNGVYGSHLEEGDIIYDPDIYQTAFQRIDEAIYARSTVPLL